MSEDDKFFEKHLRGGGLVLVEIYWDDGCSTAVFSSLQKAREWTKSVGDYRSALFAPIVVDVPEYGNVPGAEH